METTDPRNIYQKLFDAVADDGVNSRPHWNSGETEWSFVHVSDDGHAYKIIVEVMN